MRTSRSGGGTPAALASGQTMSDPPSVAVSGSSTVYWTTSTDVMSYSGAGAQTFAANQYPYAVATDGTNVYWTSGLSNGAVMQQSTTGGSPIAIATNQYYPNTIAIDASNVYWTTGARRGRHRDERPHRRRGHPRHDRGEPVVSLRARNQFHALVLGELRRRVDRVRAKVK